MFHEPSTLAQTIGAPEFLDSGSQQLRGPEAVSVDLLLVIDEYGRVGARGDAPLQHVAG